MAQVQPLENRDVSIQGHLLQREEAGTAWPIVTTENMGAENLKLLTLQLLVRKTNSQNRGQITQGLF